METGSNGFYDVECRKQEKDSETDEEAAGKTQ